MNKVITTNVLYPHKYRINIEVDTGHVLKYKSTKNEKRPTILDKLNVKGVYRVSIVKRPLLSTLLLAFYDFKK